MSTRRPTDRKRDNSLPPPPGSGPKPDSDERVVRSARLRPKDVEPVKPATEPAEVVDSTEYRLEQLKEYHRRLRETRAKT